MPVYQAAVRLADELGVLDRCVFFGDWVPYEEWPNYLVESDIGLSLHFDTLETQLAFRSRLLDYIWAGLPTVVTRGDATSELVSRFELGETVDYERQDEVADVLLRLLETSKADFAGRFERARVELTWEKTAAPLVAFCRHPRRAPDRGESVQPSSTAWGWRELAAQPSTELEALRATVAQQDAETVRLRRVIEGYEQGRFIRLMKWLHDLGS
jgi:hypothetical protein